MRSFLIKPLLIILIFGTGNSMALAQDTVKRSPITDKLKGLYAETHFEQAFQFASENLITMEGEPEFDLYYGLAAMQVGRYPQAQFIFERLVSLYPEQARYRLEYARTLYHVEQYEQAREQFNTVLSTNPPASVKLNIQRFLDSMSEREAQQKRRWSGYLGFGSGYDSNINNTTDQRFIGLFELPDTSQEMESGFASLNTALSYKHQINQVHSLHVGFDSQHKHNFATSEFNLDTGRLKAFWQKSQPKRQYQLGISYLHVLLDSEDYQRDSGIFAQWREQWSKHFLTFLYTGFFNKDYLQTDDQDSYQPIIGLSFLIPHERLLHTITLATGTENRRGDGLDSSLRDFSSLGYRLNYRASPRLSYFIGASGFFARYKDDNPVFGEARDDDSIQLSTGAEWRLQRNLSAFLELGHTNNASTLDLYDYTRSKGEVKVRWTF